MKNPKKLQLVKIMIGDLSPYFLSVIVTVVLRCCSVASQRVFDESGMEFVVRQDSVKVLLENRVHDIAIIDLIIFGAIVIMGLELTSFVAGQSGKWIPLKYIPVRGKHLDKLNMIDVQYILFSKVNTVPFMYFYMKFAYEQPNIVWDPTQMTFWNVVVPIPTLFIIFDFFYTILHWFLHLQSVYPYIHKHHHRQKAPSRANLDAVNAHPVEFVLGEYNHLLSIYIGSRFVFKEIHLVAILGFVVIGGLLAGFSHTRHDVVISMPWFNKQKVVLFDSKDHDVHHRIPTSNYGQYTMFWDHLFGSYRPYNPNDRVNPNYQLDPKTGTTKCADSSVNEKYVK